MTYIWDWCGVSCHPGSYQACNWNSWCVQILSSWKQVLETSFSYGCEYKGHLGMHFDATVWDYIELSIRDVSLQEFYFSIREFQISRLVEYSKLNAALWRGRCNTRECCWLGGGRWEVQRQGKLWQCQIMKRARLCRVLYRSCQTSPTDRRCRSRLITCCGCNCPTMNSRSRTDWLGHMYSLVEVSITGATVVLQILIAYRCCVDKVADSTCVCSLLLPRPPGLPTDSSHIVACGSPPLPLPIGN